MDNASPDFIMTSMQYLSTIFVFAVGLGVVAIIVLFILDVTQTKDAVRKNYPVVGRFRYLFSSLGEFEQIKPLIMATSISRIKKGSGIVEIVTKVPAGEIADSSRFHGQLVDEIMPELNKSAELTKIGIHDNIFAARSRIVNLKGSIIGLEQDLLDEANSQVASNQLLKDEIGLRKANVQSEIDILTERVKYLELTLSNTGSLVLLKAGVSGNSSRLTKPGAYAIILLLSVLLALFLVMGVIFARKVKERMAAGG
jgi:hypothetical protein